MTIGQRTGEIQQASMDETVTDVFERYRVP